MTLVRQPLAVGIDVGGTKVALGIVDALGSIGRTDRIENREAGGPRQLLATVVDRARRLVAEAPDGAVAAIGVALPELVDTQGAVRSAYSIPWTHSEVLAAFASIAPVTIEADVRAAALAEARFGAGRGYRTLGFVTVGTGISSCLVIDGTPYAGAHGAAQLLGSAPIALRCPHCQTMVRVTLEDLSSGPVLAARFAEHAGRAITRSEELFEAFEQGDPFASEIVAESAEILGSFLALFANIVDPEAIVVGGGLGSVGGEYWERIVDSARRHIWAEHVRSLPISRAALGPNAGFVGAGYGALRELVRNGIERHD
jgi:glucokinase